MSPGELCCHSSTWRWCHVTPSPQLATRRSVRRKIPRVVICMRSASAVQGSDMAFRAAGANYDFFRKLTKTSSPSPLRVPYSLCPLAQIKHKFLLAGALGLPGCDADALKPHGIGTLPSVGKISGRLRVKHHCSAVPLAA
eukprot:GGOE01048236.1.p2 GENE.GGOE01048236.1~~GGOE01048236.1.p2  ORF type:complete len:140 (-),score=7.74 GGOE01048236.1:50-469(-)